MTNTEPERYRDDVRTPLLAAGWVETAAGSLVADNGAFWAETNDSLDSGVDSPDKAWSVLFGSDVPAPVIVAVATVAAKGGEDGVLQRLCSEIDGAHLARWEEEQDHQRTRLAWKSAARRAQRRQPHEREGLIFHLERENSRLHAFIRLANDAARASSTAWEESSADAFRLREEVGRLHSQRAQLRARMEADIRKARFTDADLDVDAASPEELRAHVRELRTQLEETTGHRTYWHHEVQCADARLRELEAQVRQATAGGDR
ncbi:hypothetical protein [Streptomyces coerulescens]|uniref:PE-PGRS family protein n=1 Tax=Streptomyces coerulescens TaxID=29304 RepID=A0ABW0CN82_STRCD